MSNPIALPTLLGEYPGTRALRRGEVKSDALRLDFAEVKSAASAFKRVVRDLEFEVAELAVVTFLLRKQQGSAELLHWSFQHLFY